MQPNFPVRDLKAVFIRHVSIDRYFCPWKAKNPVTQITLKMSMLNGDTVGFLASQAESEPRLPVNGGNTMNDLFLLKGMQYPVQGNPVDRTNRIRDLLVRKSRSRTAKSL